MNKIIEALKWFLHSKDEWGIIARTLVEAVLSYIASYLAPQQSRGFWMGLFYIIITVILSVLRNYTKDEEE